MSSERQEINSISPWWGEHIHRYEEVIVKLTGNEKILDIACGSGFGSHLLSARTTGQVYGGDLSSEAINLCQKTWNKDNLLYEIMDGTQLKFEDNSFDVVVSFETIEHTTMFNEMILELKRTVKPTGTIYLSTPNKKVNSPSGIVTNPYHTQEWNTTEFREILKKNFDSYELFGQEYNRYSRKNLAYYIETLFYKKGIRKTPLVIQDKIMNLFGQKSMYPQPSEFRMTKKNQRNKEM